MTPDFKVGKDRELRQMTRFVEEINKVRTMLLNHFRL